VLGRNKMQQYNDVPGSVATSLDGGNR